MSEEKEVKKKSCLWRVVKVLLILFIVCVLAFNVLQRCTSKSNAKPKLWERIATAQDVNFSVEKDFPVSIVIKIEPLVEIDNLTIEIVYRNGSGIEICRGYESFGNVSPGQTYTREIVLSEVSSSFKIYSAIYGVYDGTVSLI